MLQVLWKRLEKYDPVYVKILSKATPYLKQGSIIRSGICYAHTLYGTSLLLDFLEKNPILSKEQGVLIPAMILHDIGYCKYTEETHSEMFRDVNETQGDLDAVPEGLIHQKEGARIAERILRELNYDKGKAEEICYIISIHDQIILTRTHEKARIISDFDRLMRYEHFQFWSYVKSGLMTKESRIGFLERGLDKWFWNPSIRTTAKELLEARRKESPAVLFYYLYTDPKKIPENVE